MSRGRLGGTRRPATFAAWVIQPMTTMIRKSRGLVAASILTAVIMSFPNATTSEAMVQRDQRARRLDRKDLPDRLATEHMAREAAHPLRGMRITA